MAWKETCVMEERMSFVLDYQSGSESLSELCRCYGVSRKTGYKWIVRYEAEGLLGLEDRSRRPHSNSRSVPGAVVEAVEALRYRHRSWGPRKVKAWLEAHAPARDWPSASTIGAIFDRVGLTQPRKRRLRIPCQSQPFAACHEPNDVWCIDFKGWFLTGDGTQVDPLTLSDGASRYLIACEAVGRTDEAHVWPVMEAAFHDHGLPKALRSDNGPPFASRAAGGLSRLAVKLIKVGISPERIEPGKPQQNGRHERMHLTLKQDTASPPARSLQEQMARFERFQETYNQERPHEALGQIPPARVYRPSPRRYDGVLRSPDYGQDCQVRRVRRNGEIKWRGRTVFVSEVLVGEPVGLFQQSEDLWLLKYGPCKLATIKGKGKLQKLWPKSRSRPKSQSD